MDWSRNSTGLTPAELSLAFIRVHWRLTFPAALRNVAQNERFSRIAVQRKTDTGYGIQCLRSIRESPCRKHCRWEHRILPEFDNASDNASDEGLGLLCSEVGGLTSSQDRGGLPWYHGVLFSFR